MKEPIQQSGSEVAIVIYDAPLPPRYFRFTKKFIRTLFVVTPICLGLLFLTLFIWGLGSRLKEVEAPAFPQILDEQDTKLQTLEAELKDIKESNQALVEKLATQAPTTAVQDDPFLISVKKPYGMQNLIAENRVSLDQFELTEDPNKTSLKFQIISTTPETRVTGHILVFMVSASGLMAYPAEANQNLTTGIKYSQGEPFAVSRLRPTNAEFLHKLTGDSVKFVIYIFSREGDLLLTKETETYKVGPKL